MPQLPTASRILEIGSFERQIIAMKRIAVNVKNEIGAIASVAKVFADHHINITSLNTEFMDDTGVIFISTADEDHDKSLWALADAGYRAITEEALLLRLRDEPGALAKVADKLRSANINIQSLHILNRSNGNTTVSLSTEDQDTARELVSEYLVR